MAGVAVRFASIGWTDAQEQSELLATSLQMVHRLSVAITIHRVMVFGGVLGWVCRLEPGITSLPIKIAV